jgi:hypothetical protein
MPAAPLAEERIVRNLQEALARLHEDIARVELWADALGSFVQPIPEYDPADAHLNKFLLPQTQQPAARDGKALGAGTAAVSEKR